MGPYTNNTVKNKHNVNMYMDALDYIVLCPYLDTRSDLYQIDSFQGIHQINNTRIIHRSDSSQYIGMMIII